MSVGKSSLARAAEVAAKANENEKKTEKPLKENESERPSTVSSVPGTSTEKPEPEKPKRKKSKIDRPGSDVEAMPTEVLMEELVPHDEVSRPAKMPSSEPLPEREDPGVPVQKPYVTLGEDLPTYLL